MNCSAITVAALMLTLPMSSVVAAPDSQRQLLCTVSVVSGFQNKTFRDDKRTLEEWYGDQAAKIFIVDRLTGELNGRLISNKNLEIQLIDNGNKDGQSVKILSTVKSTYAEAGYMHAMYLEIMLYAAGRGKPFILVDKGSVITGTCE